MANLRTSKVAEIPSTQPGDLTPFHRHYDVASGDLILDDTHLVMQFSSELTDLYTELINVVCTDLDVNATETITWSLGVGDADGVIDTAIITDSIIGQDPGEDVADASAPRIIEVAGKYLIFEVTGAVATAVAGAIDIYGAMSRKPGVITDTLR